MKQCSRCKKDKPLNDFGYRPERSSHRSQCKDCHAACGREWRAHNPDAARQAVKKWRKANREAALRIGRRRRYKRVLGLTLEEAMAILESQGFRCANPSCGAELSWGRGPQSAAFDHDHVTSAARGFLCSGCNKALGYLADNPERIRGLAVYLEDHNAKVLAPKANQRVSEEPERHLGNTQ